MTGGGGADTFRYITTLDSTGAAMDEILDFAPGTDKIDLSRIDANSLAGGDQAFSWIGSNAFTGSGAASAGELRAYQNNGTGSSRATPTATASPTSSSLARPGHTIVRRRHVAGWRETRFMSL
jgi:hypothetical protein